ncbi:hypothetical protein CEXT_444991 [Caerostris extrusa]|uniref:Uncharacterized protein n=1 Tax=Caerostris extrusa TaxID=172846 RepID=A0AAV4UPE7_CAEEX|nr:hypothetical protein CEXT_444991 [Caerostris extrusa]
MALVTAFVYLHFNSYDEQRSPVAGRDYRSRHVIEGRFSWLSRPTAPSSMHQRFQGPSSGACLKGGMNPGRQRLFFSRGNVSYKCSFISRSFLCAVFDN